MADIDISAQVTRTGLHYFAFGEFSDVYRGVLTTSGQVKEVALKVMRGSRRDMVDGLVKNLRREGAKWRTLKHDNVAEFYGLALNMGPMPALVLPYYPKGNVVTFVRETSPSGDEKLRLIKEVASGISYLHEHNIVHGDIRGANVLVTAEGRAVLVDFGLAFLINSGEFTTSKTAGNSRWTAPELMSAEDEDVTLSFSTDVFAFAMTVIEIYTENRPFNAIKNDTTVLYAVISGKRPDIPANIKESGSLRRLIERCWDQNPSKRPTVSSICESLFSVSSILAF
ncbi:kinase-like domain-containing protein [Mycena floridula]|nr:kinase-like domain-containing protein [Mycena floridula]